MKGPYGIVCRGHSGSRLLCEALRQNRFWMGRAENEQRDSYEFAQRHPEVRELVRKGFWYPGLDDQEKENAQRVMIEVTDRSRSNCPNPQDMIAFGWKRPVMVFASEIVLDAYPEGKIIHIIRDGRDVMLSRLNSRMSKLHEPLNRLAVFGNSSITEYRGLPMTELASSEFRNEIEMLHWVTAVTVGMRCRRYAGRYLEVRYEELCTSPESTMTKVFEFLGVPFSQQARDWIVANASPRAIGKWRGRESELADAIRIGEPLLKELGYM